MSNEISAVNKWLIQALAADPALSGINAWVDIVPEGESYPCILFSALTSRDRVGAGAVRLLTRPLYVIRAVGTGDSFAPLVPIANGIDRAVQAASGTAPVVIDGVTIRGSFREEPLQSSKAENGILYRYLGGLYRVFCYPSEGAANTASVPVFYPPSALYLVQQQLADLQSQFGVLDMSFKNSSTLTGKRPTITLTSATVLTKPTVPTDYLVDTTTAAFAITLWISTGDGSDCRFYKTAGSAANPASFVLNVADTAIATLSNTILTNIGDEQGWEEIATNKWGAL